METNHKMKSWLRRRFWDFRHGHSTYLGYALGFINVLTTTYYLLISNMPPLKRLVPYFWMYALSFLLVYPLLAILVGHKEFRTKQYPTDVEITTLQNPFLRRALPGKERDISYPATILRLKLDLKQWKKMGVLTPEDEIEMRKLIHKMAQLRNGETLET